MKKSPQLALIPLMIIMLLGVAMGFLWLPAIYSYAFAGLGVTAFIVAFALLSNYKKNMSRALDDIFLENLSASSKIIGQIEIPAVLIDDKGFVIWANPAFGRLYGGKDIRRVLDGFDPKYPQKATAAQLNGRDFMVMSMPVERMHERAQQLTFQYWLDRTEAIHYSRLYEEHMSVVALIYVDNYDELSADKHFLKNAVLGDVEKLVGKLVADIEGTYRRYDNTRFMVIFEAVKLLELEKNRFALLDAAHEIDTGTQEHITLSIAVGAESRVALSDESARQGMELALGRGGDQAVVKRGAQYTFFGGRIQPSTKQSRVKTRLFAKALRQLMENSDQVFVMGHRHADMDCVGAALGLMRCANIVQCRAYMVVDESNVTIENALATMRTTKLYQDAIRTVDQAMNMAHTGSVLIVVDTQRESTVISKELYQKFSRTVIMDHHRRPVDALQNPTLTYLEAGASSTSEMVTEVMQYFDDSPQPTSFECGALLAGITVDTKRFAFNTGARTFEAASYLRRHGADTGLVKLMFQDDMQTYIDRSNVVERARVLEHGVAISTCEPETKNASLVAAQAADELINIKDIQASFVFAHDQEDNTIMISGRSLGEINVQLVLEKLGGGGHLTVAGAQLSGCTMQEAIARLEESLNTYLKEAEII